MNPSPRRNAPNHALIALLRAVVASELFATRVMPAPSSNTP